MAVQRVTITSSEERYAPPAQEIDITVVGDQVFIDVFSGGLDDLKDGRKKEFSVPVLTFGDLMHALQAFNGQDTLVLVRHG